MALSSEEVRHMAVLARVGMSDDEIERMRDEMSHILENFDVLSQVDTEGVEVTGHVAGLTTVMRKDEIAPSSPVEDVLSNAPSKESDFIRVRAVFE